MVISLTDLEEEVAVIDHEEYAQEKEEERKNRRRERETRPIERGHIWGTY